MKNKTLLLLCVTLVLTAIVEPAYASSNDLLFQEPESLLCSLNNKFCKDKINNQSINEKIKPVEGGIFNVIDDALNNHVADVNVRMFRYMVAKKSDNAEVVTEEAKRLNDEVLSIQTAREALGKKLKAGIITPENYALAVKNLEIEEKYNQKQASEMAKIVRDDLKDVKLSNEFDKVTKTKEDRDKKGINEKETVSGTKGKDNEAEGGGKSKTGEADTSNGGSKGESGDKSDSGKDSSKGENGDKSDSSTGSSGDKSEGNKGSTGNSGEGSGGGGGGSSGGGGGGSGGGGGDSSGGGGGGSGGGGGGGSGDGGGGSGGGSSGGGSGGGGGGSSGGGGGGSGGGHGGGGGGHGGGKGGD